MPRERDWQNAEDWVSEFGPRYYDRKGEQITVRVWLDLLREPDYRVLARTRIGDDEEVSTVWLGLDYSFGLDDTPLIFETMVFACGSSDALVGDYQMALHDVCERYATKKEALAGHRRIVELLRIKAPDAPDA